MTHCHRCQSAIDFTAPQMCGCKDGVTLRLLAEVAAVFGDVSLPRHAPKIVDVVVHGVPVVVVNDAPLRNWPKVRFPYNDRPEFPKARFSDLNKGASTVALCESDSHGSNRSLTGWHSAFLELGCWRHAKPLFPAIPRRVPLGKGVRRRQPSAALVALHGLTHDSRKAGRRVPHAAALSRAKPGRVCPVVFDLKQAAADFTRLGNHGSIIVNCQRNTRGSGTTGLACKRLGRRCILIELDAGYCDIAANRLANEPMPLPFVRAAVESQGELFTGDVA